jgi:hydrocephalus-inducing protein
MTSIFFILTDLPTLPSDSKRKPHTASVIVNVGETATFDVVFRPSLAQRSQGSIHLTVVNNQYEDSVVQLVGEGYEDDVSLDNIHSVLVPVDPETEEGCMADDDIPGKNNRFLYIVRYCGEITSCHFFTK